MRPTERFLKHPFVARVLEDLKPGVLAGVQRIFEHVKDKNELPAKVPETDEDSYEFRVGRRVQALMGRLDRLRESLVMLQINPGADVLKRLEVSRAGWIEYHYAVYAVNLASLGDLSVLLTADAFELGIAKRHATADVVKSAPRIRKSSAKFALDGLETAIRSHRETRNLYIHRGESFDLDKVSGTGLFPYLQLTTLVATIDPNSVPARHLQAGFRFEAKALGEALEKELEVVIQSLMDLLEALRPEYEKRREA